MTEDMPEDVKASARRMRRGLCLESECAFERGCGCLDAIANAFMEQRVAERERIAALLQDPTAVLANALRGGINASSIRADERDRCVVLCNDYAESYEKALPLYGAADKDIGRGRQEGHIKAARDIAAAIRGDGNGEG